MLQDQLEATAGMRPLVERDLDDLAEPFVGRVRAIVLQRRDDRPGLGDGAEVRPGGHDVARPQQAAADGADRLDHAVQGQGADAEAAGHAADGPAVLAVDHDLPFAVQLRQPRAALYRDGVAQPPLGRVAVLQGLRVEEVPVRMLHRTEGTSFITPIGSAYYIFKTMVVLLVGQFRPRVGERAEP